ncbi:MAG: Mbeg1-like protein [Pseudomonadota bacterium]
MTGFKCRLVSSICLAVCACIPAYAATLGGTSIYSSPDLLQAANQALPYANLSAAIYECDKDNCKKNGTAQQGWNLIDESTVTTSYKIVRSSVADSTPAMIFRDGPTQTTPSVLPKTSEITLANTSKLVNLPPSIGSVMPAEERVINDPIGFHAVVYKNPQGKIAVIFEGTTLSSYNDWKANLGQFLQAIPSQYEEAIDFVRRIIEAECGKGNQQSCKNNIVVSGHSLGGGLAQYAALMFGLNAYIFNPAGLWSPTIASVDREMADQANIVLFKTKGYQVLGNLGRLRTSDVVSKTGTQFARNEFVVPVELSKYSWNPVSDAIEIHGMVKLKDAIAKLDSEFRSASLATRNSVSEYLPPLVAAAPEQFSETAVCFGVEGSMCLFDGERWLVEKDVVTYFSPTSLTRKGLLHGGQWVTPMRFLYISTRGYGRVGRIHWGNDVAKGG